MSLIAETQRLEIVSFTPGDTDLLHQLTGNEEVMKFLPKVLTYEETNQMIRKILDHYQIYGYCFWKAVSKSSQELIGIAGLLHQEIDGEVETEISYRTNRQYWNNGYATEAAKACKKYGEDTLGTKRLISIIHPRNASSIRVAQKLGAKKEKSVVFIGEMHDVYVY
jgi:[ribosomal protein S5]-alanine N-acetyltransferase